MYRSPHGSERRIEKAAPSQRGWYTSLSPNTQRTQTFYQNKKDERLNNAVFNSIATYGLLGLLDT
jgi:hypothetical protein